MVGTGQSRIHGGLVITLNISYSLLSTMIVAPLLLLVLRSCTVDYSREAKFSCVCVHSSAAFWFTTTVVRLIQIPAFHSLDSCLPPYCFQTFAFDQVLSTSLISSGHVSFSSMRLLSGDLRVSYRDHVIPKSSNCSRTQRPGLSGHGHLPYILPSLFVLSYPTTLCPPNKTIWCNHMIRFRARHFRENC